MTETIYTVATRDLAHNHQELAPATEAAFLGFSW